MIEVLETFEGLLNENYKVLFFDKVWEKSGSNWKVIYNIQGLTTNDSSMFYPNLKFIFWLNERKDELTDEVVTYLYEQYCDYRSTKIGNIEETFDRILNEIKGSKTTKELAGFILNGTDEFNKILKKEGINDFISDMQFIPHANKSCLNTHFGFKIESNTNTYYFNLKSLKGEWELNVDDSVEYIQMNEVYEKIITTIYGTK